MKVYSPEQNYKLNKIKMAAKIYSRELTHENVDFDPKVSKAFKEAYPHYSLPVVELPSGKFITGTNSILIYLAGGSQASVMQYLQMVEKELEPATGVLNLQIKGYEEINEGQLEKSKQIHIKIAKLLNDRLGLQTFLVGDRLTIADIKSVISMFEKDWEKLKNLNRWMAHLRSIV